MSSSVSILCPCVMCQDLKNGHRLTLKSLFTMPTMKLFLVSNERYGQINTFLLWYYGTDFALIKRYDQFCFLLLYIRRHSFFLLSALCCLSHCCLSLVSTLSLCSYSLSTLLSLFSLSGFLSLLFIYLLSFFFLSAHSLFFLCLFSISALFLCSFSTLYFFIFFWTELDLEECQILSLM